MPSTIFKEERSVFRPADGDSTDAILSDTCCDSEDSGEEGDSNGRNRGSRNSVAIDSDGKKAPHPTAVLHQTPSTAVGCRPALTATTADITSAFLRMSVRDGDTTRQQLSTANTNTTAAITTAPVSPCPPSLTLSPIAPATTISSPIEPRGETAPWPESLLSMIRSIVQQEVGRADQPGELVARLVEECSPLLATPGGQADSTALSAAAVIPKVVGPEAPVDQPPSSGYTTEVEALRVQSGFQFSSAFPPSAVLPTSLPSFSSSSSLASSSSSFSSLSQLSPLSSPTSQTIKPFMSTAASEQFTRVEPTPSNTAAKMMLSSRLSSIHENSYNLQARPMTDSLLTSLPSPRLGQPVERRSSVQFREPFVQAKSTASENTTSSARSGGGDTQSRGLKAAADMSPKEAVELTPVDQKWGILFDPKGQATGRFTEVMQSLARFIIEKRLPEGHIVIVPEKLVSFYSFPRVEGELVFYAAIFKSSGNGFHRKISELYQDLGCSYHLVQAKPASRPHVPALTPNGFARWMTLNAQAFPDEEARRLDRVVSTSPLEARSALDGKLERLPKQLSRHLLPKMPDYRIRDLLLQAVKRHFGDSCLDYSVQKRGGPASSSASAQTPGPASVPLPPSPATASPSQQNRQPSASFPSLSSSAAPRGDFTDRERIRRDSIPRGRPSSLYYDREQEEDGRQRNQRPRSSQRHGSHRSPSRARNVIQGRASIADGSRSRGSDRQQPLPSSPAVSRQSSRRASFAGGTTGTPAIVIKNSSPHSGALPERGSGGPRTQSYRSSYPEEHSSTVDSDSNASFRHRRPSFYGSSSRSSAENLPTSATRSSFSGPFPQRYEETAHTHNGRDRDRHRDRELDRERQEQGQNAERSRETQKRMPGIPISRSDGIAAAAATAGDSSNGAGGTGLTYPTADPQEDDLLLTPRANTRRRMRGEAVRGSRNSSGSRRGSTIVSGDNEEAEGYDSSQTWDDYLRR